MVSQETRATSRGTACLMINDFLLTEQEELAITKGARAKGEAVDAANAHFMAQPRTCRETHALWNIRLSTPPGPSLSPLPESAIAYCPASQVRRALTPAYSRPRSPGTVPWSRQSLDRDCSFERPALQTSYGRSCHLRRGHRTGSEPRIACALRPTGCAVFSVRL
jgi:hypothetical protein